MRLQVIELFIVDGSIQPLETWEEIDKFREAHIQLCFRLEDEQLVQLTVRSGMDDAFVWINRAIHFYSKGTMKWDTEKKEMVVDPIDPTNGFRGHNRMMQNPRQDLPDEPHF